MIKNFIDAFAYNGGANVAKMVVVIIGAFTQNRRANVAIVIVVIVKAIAKAFAAHIAKVIGIIIAFAKAFAAQITIMVKRIEIIALGQSFAAIKAEMIFFARVVLFPCPRIAAIEIAEVIVVIVIAEMSAATKVTIGILVLIPAIMSIASIVAFGIPIVICAFTKIGVLASIIAPMITVTVYTVVIDGSLAIIASAVFICVCMGAKLFSTTYIACMISVIIGTRAQSFAAKIAKVINRRKILAFT